MNIVSIRDLTNSIVSLVYDTFTRALHPNEFVELYGDLPNNLKELCENNIVALCLLEKNNWKRIPYDELFGEKVMLRKLNL